MITINELYILLRYLGKSLLRVGHDNISIFFNHNIIEVNFEITSQLLRSFDSITVKHNANVMILIH